MAKIEHIDNKKRGDKLTAHLALGAEETQEPIGRCLTEEELADVAADLCSPEEKEAAIAHFSSCSKCYDAWVAISFAIAAAHRGSVTPKRSFITIRSLTYVGSAFAIAASVAIFLNVRNMSYETGIISQPDEAVQELNIQREERVAAPAIRKREVAPKSMVKPAPAPGTPEPVVSPTESKSALFSLGNVTQSGEELESVIGSVESEGIAENTDLSSQTKPEWIADVLLYCQGQSQDLDGQHLNNLIATGERLLVDGQIDTRFRDIIPLLQSIRDSKESAVHCNTILRLLAEEKE